VHTLEHVNVVWDPAKARANQRKHGVSFADAAVSLEDENALTVATIENREYRFKTLGMSPNMNVLLVVHAEENEDTISIISARVASASQKRQYFAGDYHE
jgi:uncharacterized DUF497 family protein